jgi:hypothetical protein
MRGGVVGTTCQPLIGHSREQYGRDLSGGGEMSKNEPVEIYMVANGFMVRPQTRLGEALELSKCHAFNSLNDLSKWLLEHFDNHHAKPNDQGKRK